MMIGGIICIVIGIGFLYQVIKRPAEGDYGAINLKGYGAAVAFIILGIVILLDRFGML